MGIKVWTLDEIRESLISLFPEGTLYDWYNSLSWVYQNLDGIAQSFLTYCYNMLDTLRQETNPATVIQKLPEWEAALGISSGYAALKGTTAQRQAAVLGKLREFGAFTSWLVQSVLGPVLGYVNPQSLVVYETKRVNLTAIHTYYDIPAAPISIPNAPSSPLLRTIWVPDGGLLGKTGAQVTVRITHPNVEQLTFILTAPGAPYDPISGAKYAPMSKTWANIGSGNVTNQDFILYGASLAGSQAGPGWTLSVQGQNGGTSGTLVQWNIFVEGYGLGGLGGDIEYWGAFADPALVGQSGIPADYAGAEAAIQRIKHAHTIGHLIRSLVATPDAPLTIPDQVFPG